MLYRADDAIRMARAVLDQLQQQTRIMRHPNIV
jgi:hypothetical protein